ncbi:MAG: hypothetical protein J5803_00715, partial [Desulfovibrio sp.]|nr:hypothetical protein [Desulfovibrio sp.]
MGCIYRFSFLNAQQCVWLLASCLCAVLFLLPVMSLSGSDDVRALYPEGEYRFDPANPAQHATWKGRHTLPYAQMQTLCHDVCSYLGVHPNAADFLLEIAAAESDFGYYVRQVKGPAQSVWQIEPETARDMHTRLARKNPLLYRKIIALRDPGLEEEDNVVTNLDYGAALCVGVLIVKGIRFDALNSLAVRAETWKRFYNTY